MSRYEIVGLMSGTSIDGLDITHATFTKNNGKWSYELHHSKTYLYTDQLTKQLRESKNLSVSALLQLDKTYGKEISNHVLNFLNEFSVSKDGISAISSHGHTIYHQPKNGFSYQIGCGSTIAYHTGIPVINDFRNKDIIAGGQGAPLVPIGDQHLFVESADAFLNLGGFCNITFQDSTKKWKAFDISPCNIPLNKLAEQKNKSFDEGGKIAESGTIDFFLLDLLNNLDFYKKRESKSLGTEWLDEFFFPLLKFDKNTADNLCTLVEHVAFQISSVLNENSLEKVLVTGGGAYNTYLLSRIKHHSNVELMVPSSEIIEFKESLIFGFLGALYLEKEPNTLPTATGASKKVISGVFHCP